MTKEEKQLLKIYNKTEDEKIKKVLGRLLDDEEVVEKEEIIEVEEKEEVVEEKEVKKEEPKKEEIQSQNITLSKDELSELINGVLEKYATKEELDEVKKKAKPFGAKQKVEKVETKEQPNTQDLVDKLNRPFV